MKLTRLYDNKHCNHYCPSCGYPANCPHCNLMGDWCENCGEAVFNPEALIIHSTGKYYGAHNPSSHDATLMVNGDSFATVHVTRETDLTTGSDIAHLQLMFIPEEKQTEAHAKIIADFASWARDDWVNPDKQSGLETLVKLIGFKTFKDKEWPWRYEPYERFIALDDATKITREHLAYEVTSIDITPA